MATITVTDLALELNTDPRTTRKFLRSITPADAQPGKGSRWAIEKREVRSLKSKFTKFTAEQETARLERDAKRAAALDDTQPITLPDAEGEPTDAELESIDEGEGDDE